MIGLVGRKKGTNQHFIDGRAVQVTFIEVLPHRIVQVKTKEKHGYQAIQVTTGEKASFRLTKAEAGHFNKAQVLPGDFLGEFRFDDKASEWQIGQELKVDYFSSIKKVDVTSQSKGKGFAGGIKRHNFSSQDATHGNSLSHRARGSSGGREQPVLKGTRMAGQLGAKQVTMQSLEVLEVIPEGNLLKIKGSVPGMPGCIVKVQPAARVSDQFEKED